MPSKDAHSSRNWAITMQAPAAMSWVSLIASETKLRTVATVNAATAKESCMGLALNIYANVKVAIRISSAYAEIGKVSSSRLFHVTSRPSPVS